MENKLIVSLITLTVHGGDSVQKNMYGVLIALTPAFLASLYFFGLGALDCDCYSRGSLCVLRMGYRESILIEETRPRPCWTARLSSQVCCSAFNLPSNLADLDHYVWVHCLRSV